MQTTDMASLGVTIIPVSPTMVVGGRHLGNASLNQCEYPINAGIFGGINNTIKATKRDTYGFRDQRGFMPKAKQAFDLRNISAEHNGLVH